jgi:hypothetical protein
MRAVTLKNPEESSSPQQRSPAISHLFSRARSDIPSLSAPLLHASEMCARMGATVVSLLSCGGKAICVEACHMPHATRARRERTDNYGLIQDWGRTPGQRLPAAL